MYASTAAPDGAVSAAESCSASFEIAAPKIALLGLREQVRHLIQIKGGKELARQREQCPSGNQPVFDRPNRHLRLQEGASALNRTKPTLDSRRFRVVEIPFAVVSRTQYPLIPEMHKELVEVLHHHLDVRPYG